MRDPNLQDLALLLETEVDPVLVVDSASRLVLTNRLGGSLMERMGWRDVPELPVLEPRLVHRDDGRTLQLLDHDLDWHGRRLTLLRFRDITDQVRSGDLQRRLLHSDRLAAMGQLAAGVAHEVNNPAAFVTANLCLVQEQLEASLRKLDDADRHCDLRSLLQECVEVTRENLQGMSRISAIVRDLRRFSRIERETVEWVHVNEAVNAACNIVHNHIRHKAQLIKDLQEVPVLPADRHKLTQVLMNLLMNASQAIEEGAPGQSVRVKTRCEDGWIRVAVIDTGRGIPDSIKERIFDPFFTTKGHEQGTGLGLALCADIVRQHGGRIEVESRIGAGSCFQVLLPVENGLQPRGAAPEEEGGEVADRRGRVLLVDDEPLLLKAYRRSLGRRHEVQTAEGGREAIDVLTQDAEFDVVVCDLMMPEVDGIEVYEWVRENRPELAERFLFCSGGAFTSRAGSFCQSVELPMLDKPVPIPKLEAAIQSSMQRRSPPALSETLDLSALVASEERLSDG